MADLVLVTNTDGIATITLNRPEKRNALNGEIIKTLMHTLNVLLKNDDVRVLLINGNGEHFCAGADIASMQKIAEASFSENNEDAQILADLMYQLYSFPKPTMVLAHGATLGGGLGLLSAADIALASNNATFGFSEVRLGIAPSIVSPYVLNAIGERAARYYFLTAARFDAAEAYRLGLVHHVTKIDDLLDTGKKIAQEILRNGPHALMATKQLIRYVAKEKISEDLAQKTAEHLANTRATPEAQEGLQAFLAKRSPNWQRGK